MMMENNAAVFGEGSQPKEVVLSGVPDSMHQTELSRTMHTVYERLKADKSNVRARWRSRDGSANCPSGDEVKSAGVADICIALVTSGAALAAINAIASVIARSQKAVLTVCINGKVVGSIEGRGFTDSAHIKELAAQIIESDVELQLHVGDRA